MKKIKIVVTTGTRAEYGIIRSLLQKINHSKKLHLGFKLKPIPFGDIFYKSKEKAKKGYVVPISVYRCHECKHIQNSEYINPKLLWKDYTYLSSQSQQIIDHLSEEQIVKAMNEMVCNEDKRDFMGANGIKFIEKNYTWKKSIKIMLNSYKKILNHEI